MSLAAFTTVHRRDGCPPPCPARWSAPCSGVRPRAFAFCAAERPVSHVLRPPCCRPRWKVTPQCPPGENIFIRRTRPKAGVATSSFQRGFRAFAHPPPADEYAAHARCRHAASFFTAAKRGYAIGACAPARNEKRRLRSFATRPTRCRFCVMPHSRSPPLRVHIVFKHGTAPRCESRQTPRPPPRSRARHRRPYSRMAASRAKLHVMRGPKRDIPLRNAGNASGDQDASRPEGAASASVAARRAASGNGIQNVLRPSRGRNGLRRRRTQCRSFAAAPVNAADEKIPEDREKQAGR